MNQVGNLLVNHWRERPRLLFTMWVKIEDPSCSPRETLCWRFLNSGREPIHIERIEGDNGFTLGDHFDACTIPAGPEPVTDDCAVPHVRLLERKPTTIFAVDSTGKPWPLRKGDLNEAYRVLARFAKDQAFIQQELQRRADRARELAAEFQQP